MLIINVSDFVVKAFNKNSLQENFQPIDHKKLRVALPSLLVILQRAYKSAVQEWSGLCPDCNYLLIKNGSYLRLTPFFQPGFKVQRVYCKNCKRSHALIPHFIIPFHRQLIGYDEFVIRAKAFNLSTNERIAEILDVEPISVTRWWSKVKKLLPTLISFLSRILADSFGLTDWMRNYSLVPVGQAQKLFELVELLRDFYFGQCRMEGFALINMLDHSLLLG